MLSVKDTECVVCTPQFKAGDSNKGPVVLLTARWGLTDGGLCMTGLSHNSQKDYFFFICGAEGRGHKSRGSD